MVNIWQIRNLFSFFRVDKTRIYGKYMECFESEDLIYKRFPTTITRFLACC